MTNEEINITIAEACGIISEDQWGPIYKTASGWVRDCPDYVNDLNAMHEAEKILHREQKNKYINILDDMTGYIDSVQHDFDWCCSTARQRAQAFLRTIGKWEEVQS